MGWMQLLDGYIYHACPSSGQILISAAAKLIALPTISGALVPTSARICPPHRD